MDSSPFSAVRLTALDQSHFFGYFEKSPWDAGGRYLLAMRTDTPDTVSLTGDEWADVGIIDLRDGNRFTVLDRTRSWGWQQGNMLQWTFDAPDRNVIYNQTDGRRLFAVVLDVHSGQKRELDRPIYALSPDGRHATSVNFARLGHTRPGYGYPVVPDPWRNVNIPDDDGLYITDLHTGRSRLILSYRQVIEQFPDDRPAKGAHWFNVAQYNTDGSRISFLHRWMRPEDNLFHLQVVTRFFTIAPDGSDLRLLFDEDKISHYDWRDPHTILAFAQFTGGTPGYFLFDVRTNQVQPFAADVLVGDGHPTYSPDRQWVLTDTYPRSVDQCRRLYLYKPADHRRMDLGKFYSPPEMESDVRCDLHPRWNRDATQVCFDSPHEGRRAMYVIDVSSVTG